MRVRAGRYNTHGMEVHGGDMGSTPARDATLGRPPFLELLLSRVMRGCQRAHTGLALAASTFFARLGRFDLDA